MVPSAVGVLYDGSNLEIALELEKEVENAHMAMFVLEKKICNYYIDILKI